MAHLQASYCAGYKLGYHAGWMLRHYYVVDNNEAEQIWDDLIDEIKSLLKTQTIACDSIEVNVRLLSASMSYYASSG
jgi:hypothetical protein